CDRRQRAAIGATTCYRPRYRKRVAMGDGRCLVKGDTGPPARLVPRPLRILVRRRPLPHVLRLPVALSVAFRMLATTRRMVRRRQCEVAPVTDVVLCSFGTYAFPAQTGDEAESLICNDHPFGMMRATETDRDGPRSQPSGGRTPGSLLALAATLRVERAHNIIGKFGQQGDLLHGQRGGLGSGKSQNPWR
ncbi:MAG: hypothetical protein QOG10_6749, partial [Kribbellaceae bacterium]|nr:hypothetical protein [Kribbellaceae bacterium]